MGKIGGTMRKQARKLKWQKPMLTILVRGSPEESVLFACKGGDDACMMRV